jgi:hypothetical protein
METEGEGEGLALSLPGEVWAEVAGFLSTRDLLRLASANSRLRYTFNCRRLRSCVYLQLLPSPLFKTHYYGHFISSERLQVNHPTSLLQILL